MADESWGLEMVRFYPETGGPRTQQERKDQAVVDEVRKVVKERLRSSMISSLQSLQSHFEKLDASGDGRLNQQELIGALQRAGIELNSEQIDSVWRIVDEDQVWTFFILPLDLS